MTREAEISRLTEENALLGRKLVLMQGEQDRLVASRGEDMRREHMRREALQKRIQTALDAVYAEMSNAQGKYGRGMASEGYAGGFAQALSDVHLLLGGVEPNDDRHYWRPFPSAKEKTPSRGRR